MNFSQDKAIKLRRVVQMVYDINVPKCCNVIAPTKDSMHPIVTFSSSDIKFPKDLVS